MLRIAQHQRKHIRVEYQQRLSDLAINYQVIRFLRRRWIPLNCEGAFPRRRASVFERLDWLGCERFERVGARSRPESKLSSP